MSAVTRMPTETAATSNATSYVYCWYDASCSAQLLTRAINVALKVERSGQSSYRSLISRDEDARLSVTMNEIMDLATIEGTIFSHEPGNR